VILKLLILTRELSFTCLKNASTIAEIHKPNTVNGEEALLKVLKVSSNKGQEEVKIMYSDPSMVVFFCNVVFKIT